MDGNACRRGAGNEGDSLDTVEQDSLECNAIKDGTAEFLPFAQIGMSWSNERAAQNSTCPPNTNQNVDIDSLNNQTNAMNSETNTSIATNDTVDNDFHILPGTPNKRAFNVTTRNCTGMRNS